MQTTMERAGEDEPTTGPPAEVQASAGTPTTSVGIDLLKNSVSLVVAGFGAIISFIGLKGSEMTSVLRNQEFFVALMGLFILVAVITAILSLFVPIMSPQRQTLTLGQELATVAVLLAVGAFVVRVTPIPLATTGAESLGALLSGIAALTLAVVLTGLGWHNHGRPQFLHRMRSPSQVYIFLLIFSLLSTSLAVYTALRLETRSQVSTGAETQAELQVAGQDAIVTVDVTSSKLPTQDFVNVTVTALGRSYDTTQICQGVATPAGGATCLIDPCSYPTVDQDCDSLAIWTLPPDASGDVDRHLIIPFRVAAYDRLHIETKVCERSKQASQCNYDLAPSTHVDVAVPSG